MHFRDEDIKLPGFNLQELADHQRVWAHEYYNADSQEFVDTREALNLEKRSLLDLKAELLATQDRMKQTYIRYTQLAYHIAPVRKLPDELLGEIFLQGGEHIDFFHQQELIDIRLTCRRWNRVSLETPFLWASIGYGSTVSRCCPVAFSTWISRSKDVALLNVTSGGRGWAGSLLRSPEVTSILLREFPRWGSLGLVGTTALLDMLARQRDPGTASAEVSSNSSMSKQFTLHRLHRIVVQELRFLPNSALTTMSAGRLTTVVFKACEINIGAYAKFVPNTPSVHTLGFFGTKWDMGSIYVDGTQRQSFPAVSHRQLAQLAIEDDRSQTVATIYQLIKSSPRLIYMRLKFDVSSMSRMWHNSLAEWAANQAQSIKPSKGFMLGIFLQKKKESEDPISSGYSEMTFISFLRWFAPLRRIRYDEYSWEDPQKDTEVSALAQSVLSAHLFNALPKLKELDGCIIENVRLNLATLVDFVVAVRGLRDKDRQKNILESMSFSLRNIWVTLDGSNFERFDIRPETKGEYRGFSCMGCGDVLSRIKDIDPECLGSSEKEDN
jgi:hypothetical protein